MHMPTDQMEARRASGEGARGVRRSSFVREHERYDEMFQAAETRMLEAAKFRAGDRVIDVGCGAGTTALRAARIVGEEGDVLGVDTDRGAVDFAVERARAAGLGCARFVCADAGIFAFELRRVNAIVSRFGTLHFARPVAAFEHLRAALAPGGRLAFLCARDFERNAWATVPLAALRRALPGAPIPLDATGGPFALADGNHVRRALDDAGFLDIDLTSLDAAVPVGVDVDDALEFYFETDAGPLVARLPSDALARVIESLREAFAPYAGAQGVQMPASFWLVCARAR